MFGGVVLILPRKIISASISGTVFAIVLGFVLSDNLFIESMGTFNSYLYSSVTIIPVYMMYSFPVIIVYGVITSIISDKVGEFVAAKAKENKLELMVSGALHIVFGLILFWISLGASILFFIIDRLIRKRHRKHQWIEAIKSLIIPLLTFLICMGFGWFVN